MPDTTPDQVTKRENAKLPNIEKEQQSNVNSGESVAVPAKKELPPFTLRNVILDLINGAKALVFEPKANRIIIPALVCFSSAICKLIIAKVKYTEIDFSTYMQQVELVNDGALDYSIIEGDSGPIVYPAGFVQVYQFFYWLTNEGADLKYAQLAFGYLFAITVALTCAVYTMAGDFPPWPLYLLICSKRLYSIYVLRMFNDCFATIGVICTILFLQQASYWATRLSDTMKFLLCAVSADVFSMALSVKMNVLLYLPAFVIVVYFLLGERIFRCLAVITVIPLVQILIGWRFLLPLFWDDEAKYLRMMYLTRAFDFSRKFLYKWTVNWRFVPEDIFDSKTFAQGLLAGHLLVLTVFIFTRFISPRITQKTTANLFKDALLRPFKNTTSPANLLLQQNTGPRLILLMFSITNLIGVLFARSLHYQFLSWYQWSLPFLLHASGCNVITGAIIFGAHEWCWNVFPSTVASSELLIAILTLVTAATWYNTNFWFTSPANN